MRNIFAMIGLWFNRLFFATLVSPNGGIIRAESSLSIKVIRVNKVKLFSRTWFQELRNWILRGDKSLYGIVSRNMVTSEGARFLCDAIAGGVSGVLGVVPLANYLKYCAWGTGTDPENVGDNILSLVLAAPTDNLANIIANGVAALVAAATGADAKVTFTKTLTAGGALTITEFAIIALKTDAAVIENLILFDKSLFTGIGLASGDGIAFTYAWTLKAGG